MRSLPKTFPSKTAGPCVACRRAAIRRIGDGRHFRGRAHEIDSALAQRSDKIAVDAYMTFEQVETAIRAKNPGLASELEGNFAWLRTRVLKADDAERQTIRERLLARTRACRACRRGSTVRDESLRGSFFLLVRGRLRGDPHRRRADDVLAKAGASARRREVARGAWAAVGASVITWVLVELLLQVTPGQRENEWRA